MARRRSDQLCLEVDLEGCRLIGVGGAYVVPAREALLCYLLFARVPDVLRYATIQQEVLEPFQIAVHDPMPYIRKLKLAVDRQLERVTGEVGLIVSVRSLGYRLAHEWDLQTSQSSKDAAGAASAIRNLAIQCIEVMGRTALVVDENDALTLDKAPDVIAAFRHAFDEPARTILAAASAGLVSESCQGLLSDIFSYLVFGRTGNVDEKTWRLLFERELLQRVDTLDRVCGR